MLDSVCISAACVVNEVVCTRVHREGCSTSLPSFTGISSLPTPKPTGTWSEAKALNSFVVVRVAVP